MKTNLNKHSYQVVITKYLDQDPVLWITHKPEVKWENRDRCDVEVEQNKRSTIIDAKDCKLAEDSDKTRLIKTESFGRGIP